MPTETLTESVDADLHLSEVQARALSSIGQRLASQKGWWGQGDDAEPTIHSVIRCERLGAARHRVRVIDAVGVVGIGDLQLVVQPKIDTRHFLYLLAASGQFPRLGETGAALAVDQSLWALVAHWYVTTLERLLRADLIRDYEEQSGLLTLVRGRVRLLPTAQAFYRGQLQFACQFDEFDTDNPLNRVLRAASRTIASSRLLPQALRQRAVRTLSRLDSVGDLQPADLHHQPDLRTGHYQDAFLLARQVLQGSGRQPLAGAQRSWTFLIRTPEMIEAGIRNILTRDLGHPWHAAKKGIQLTASMSLNPDLVFNNGIATADVKYKPTPKDWNLVRGDVYQAVAFATGYRTRHAAIISFSRPHSPHLPPLQIGALHLTSTPWHAGAAATPEEAALRLIEDVRAWLTSIPIRQDVHGAAS